MAEPSSRIGAGGRARGGVVALVVLAHICTSSLVAQQPAPPTAPLNPTYLDTTCAPCVDFFQYANGGWTRSATIPPAESFWAAWNETSARTFEVLRAILDSARSQVKASPAASDFRKLGTFYGTCMDSVAAEAAGLEPIEAILRRIAAIETPEGVIHMIGELQAQGTGVLFAFSGAQDPKRSTEVIAIASQGGLGLPNRDYYTAADSQSQELRKAYAAHIARMLELSGQPAASAKLDAARVLALETRLAEASMTQVQQRDPNAIYHKMTVRELQKLIPHFDWARFFPAVGAPPPAAVKVEQPDFFRAMDGLLTGVPVETWKAYLRWHLLNETALALSASFVNEHFSFRQTLTGTQEILSRWRRCLRMTSVALGDALGREYVRRAFPPEARARVMGMVDNLQAAFRERIDRLDWMSPATKKEAFVKLAAFGRKIGYPDRWIDYSALTVTPGPFVTNLLRARAFETRRTLQKIGKPVDRDEWNIWTYTVDAYYDASLNEIAFGAGILQPPWFDPNADDAVNYGGIGTVIGHELTHGFDDEGRQFDSRGNLRDWWGHKDAANYNERAEVVVDQFDKYTVLDGSLRVNGKLTLGENIADLGGVTIAYAALQKALEEKGRPPLIDGFTPEQRFFLSFARVWRVVNRPEYLRLQVNTDPHPPWNWRVNGPLSNLPAFAQAFGCEPGDPMVRPETLQAEIW